MSQRFYTKPAEPGSNSAHVMEAGRRNEFGEPYCVAPYLTPAQAEEMVKRLNAAAAQ